MRTSSWELSLLKILLGIYIFFCLVIAGLNYGYAPGASEGARKLIQQIWHFYENEFKTFLIITGAFLTLRLEGKKHPTGMRKQNLWGFIIAAMVIHILVPRLLGNPDLYFFAMPVPWTSTTWQLLDKTSAFYAARGPLWGTAGVRAVLVFFIFINILVFTGTLFLGRRWQCSTLCLFNGFASEIFAPAFPLLGKPGGAGIKTRRFMKALRVVLLAAALFYTVFWLLRLAGITLPPEPSALLIRLETWKYLLLELMLAMYFWTVFRGRGYCYACPLGTTLSVLGRAAGQKIITNNSHCIQCGKCIPACPMSIDISSRAKEGSPIIDSLCVGCGHCVDICPTETLRYSTRFLDAVSSNHRNK